MHLLAYFFLLAKSIIYGSTPYFTGRLYDNCDVLDILALRFLLSLAAMWLLKTLKIIKVGVGIRTFVKKDNRPENLHYLLLAGLFEPVLYMLFETAGIAMTSSITTAVILSLAPISSCLLEWFLFKTHPTPLQGVFLGCGIFGAIYIAVNTSAQGGQSSLLGIVFLILAVLSGSLFCAFSKKSSGKYSAFEITYISCLLGAVAFNTVNVIRHLFAGDLSGYFAPYFVPENLMSFLGLGIASTIVATAMNNYAISKVPMSTAAAFGGVSTIVTVVAGVCFGGEQLMIYHMIGLPFIFARMVGVSTITILRDKRKREREGQLRNG